MRLERRLTIDEIAERLALSRTTIYHWVRDVQVEIPRRHRTRGQIAGSEAMPAKHRLARDTAYEAGRASFATLTADPSFRDFVCVYLAEGSKRDRNRVQVCNSDPAVVKVCDRWIRQLSA